MTTETTENSPSPTFILLFESLGSVNMEKLASILNADEWGGEPVSLEHQAESGDGFVADLVFGRHKARLAGLRAPVPESVLEQTVKCSRYKPEITGPMLRHKEHIICFYEGNEPDMTERLAAMQRVARAFVTFGLLGFLDPEAWTCMPAEVVQKVGPEMVRACMQGEPLSFSIGFVKFIQDSSAVWFCTKGQHRYGLPDLARMAPLAKAKEASDKFSKLFLLMRSNRKVPSAGDTAIAGEGAYVSFREAYEFQEWLNGPAGVLVIEDTSEAEARTGGPGGSGAMLEIKDDVVFVDDQDADMRSAIALGREYLPHFWSIFETKPNGEERFSLKVRLADKYGKEHFWLSQIERKDGQLFGAIDNEPKVVKNYRAGQHVGFSENDIEDWLYYRDGKMVGNYTARVLIKGLPESEAQNYRRMFSDIVPIRIVCGCGQKFSFETVPVNNNVPGLIQCPACGADATVAANDVIARTVGLHTASSTGLNAPKETPPPAVKARSGAPASGPPGMQRSAGVAQAASRPYCRQSVLSICCVAIMFLLAIVTMVARFPLGWLAAIPGIYFGHAALGRIRSDKALRGKVLAIVALCFCYLHMTALVIQLALIATGHGNLQRNMSFRRSTSPFANIPKMPDFPKSRFVPSAPPGVPPMSPQAGKPPPGASFQSKPDAPVKTDPAKASIPSSPVSGTIKGQEFSSDQAVIQYGKLAFSRGSGPVPEFKIEIPVTADWRADLSGKTVLVTSRATVPQPVLIRWRENGTPRSGFISRNYVLRVELGNTSGNHIAGKVYFESGESQETKIAGEFDAEIKSPGAQ